VVTSVQDRTAQASQAVLKMKREILPRPDAPAISIPVLRMSAVTSNFSLADITDVSAFRRLGTALVQCVPVVQRLIGNDGAYLAGSLNRRVRLELQMTLLRHGVHPLCNQPAPGDNDAAGQHVSDIETGGQIIDAGDEDPAMRSWRPGTCGMPAALTSTHRHLRPADQPSKSDHNVVLAELAEVPGGVTQARYLRARRRQFDEDFGPDERKLLHGVVALHEIRQLLQDADLKPPELPSDLTWVDEGG
jgi:hypothetical protein